MSDKEPPSSEPSRKRVTQYNRNRRQFLRAVGVGTAGTALLPGITSAKDKDDDSLSCATGPFTRTYVPATRETSTAPSGTTAAEMSADEIASLNPERSVSELVGGREIDALRREAHGQVDSVAEALSTDAAATADGQSISVDSEFEGIVDPTLVPSDANIAAGPDDLVVAINAIWAIFDKDGTLQATFDLSGWFDNVIPGEEPNFVFDPWVRYDPEREQFYLLATYFDQDTNTGFVVLSVSDDSDPTGTWYNYAIRPIGFEGLLDFPALGFDTDAVYITQNFFERVGTEGLTFDQVSLTILDKDAISVGDPVTASVFQDLRNPDGSRAFSVRPAVQPFVEAGADEARPYFLLNSEFELGFPFGSGAGLTVWSVSDPVHEPSIACERIPTGRYFSGPFSEQPDVDVLLDTGDPRLLTVVYDEFDDTLWTAHTIAQDWDENGEFVSAIQWFEVDPFRGEIVQRGLWGESGRNYYYPAVNTTREGMQLCYSVSGPDTYARMEVAGRTDDFPAGQIEDSQVIEFGEEAYTDFNPDGFSVRWGDYWGVAIDPERETFWSIAQYAAADDRPPENDLYGTRIAETSFTDDCSCE